MMHNKIDNGEWQDITKDSIHTITNITNGNVSISAKILDNAGRYSEITSKTVKVVTQEASKNDDDSITNNDNNNSKGTTSGNSNLGESTTTEKISGKSTDSTTTPGVLPKAGEGSFVIGILVVVLIGISIIFYKKVKSYKDVK